MNPNQRTDNLVVDVFIVEETPLKYVKVSGSLDDDNLTLDRNSLPDEFPKSSKVSFRLDNYTVWFIYILLFNELDTNF